MKLPGLAITALATLAASAPAVAQSPVTARLLVSQSPDGQWWAGVILDPQPGWHTYWINPGDSGLATSVQWQLPRGVEAGPLQWPIPQRFEEAGNLTTYGYAEPVALLARLTPPTGDSIHPADVKAKVQWLACREVCLPGLVDLSGAVNTAGESPAELIERFRQRLPLPVGADPAVARVETKLQPQGKVERAEIHIQWASPVTDIQWFPQPSAPETVVRPAEVVHEGLQTVVRVPVRAVGSGATLDSVLTYRDPEGRRRGVQLPTVQLGN